MNTRQVAEATKLSYWQINYALKQHVIYSTLEFGRGRSRVFSRRDLVFLKLFYLLRKDKHRLSEVRQALSLLAKNWPDGDDPAKAGFLYRNIPDMEFNWIDDPSKQVVYGASYSGYFYDVSIVAKEVYAINTDQTKKA